jgi:hypothetical protein
VDLALHVMELAEVADLGMTWHRCRACLDTGAAQTEVVHHPSKHTHVSVTFMTDDQCRSIGVADKALKTLSCSSLLTAGNEGCTLITQGLASRLGLLDAQVRTVSRELLVCDWDPAGT